jgi:hypothetical protein
MKRLQAFFQENYKNLFLKDVEARQKYAQKAFEQLQASYEPIGGIHGNGFKSPEDMVKNIPFWKLSTNSVGDILAAIYYKGGSSKGRKSVASSTDGTAAGKDAMIKMIQAELKFGRAYGEKSLKALSLVKNLIGYDGIKKIVLPFKEVQRVFADDEIKAVSPTDPEVIRHPPLKEFFYQRLIGGEWHTKIALGSVDKFIT